MTGNHEPTAKKSQEIANTDALLSCPRCGFELGAATLRLAIYREPEETPLEGYELHVGPRRDRVVGNRSLTVSGEEPAVEASGAEIDRHDDSEDAVSEEARWAEIAILTAPDSTEDAVLSVASEITDGYDEDGNLRYF